MRAPSLRGVLILLLPDLSPEGTYWIELWYRETHGSFNVGNQQQAYGWVSGEGLPNPHVPGTSPLYLAGEPGTLGSQLRAAAAALEPSDRDPIRL